MAQPNPNSIGDAIALNYKMPSSDTAVGLINQKRREEDAAIKAARVAHAKNLADIDKYKNDLGKFNVEGIIAPLQVPVQAAANALFDTMKTESSNGGDIRNSEKVRAAKFNLDKVLSDSRVQSKAYLNDVKNGVDHPDMFKLNPAFTDAVGLGGTEGYQKWIEANNSIHQGSTSDTNKYTHGAVDAIDKTDYLEQLQKNVIGSGLKIKTAKDPETGRVVSLQAPTPTQIEEQFITASQQPWYAKMVAQQMAAGVPMEQAQKNIKATYINSIPKDVTTFSTSKPTGEGKNLLTAADVKTQVPVTIYDAKQRKDVADVAHFGVTLPTTLTANIPNAKGIISRDTGKELEADGKQFVGELNITGSKIYSSKMTQHGKDFYVPVLYATATMLDSEGKTVTKNVEVPLSMLRGDKTIEENKAGIDELQKKTDELNKPKTETSYTNVSTVKDSKGKTIKAGIKDGKWYNTETGKPLQ